MEPEDHRPPEESEPEPQVEPEQEASEEPLREWQPDTPELRRGEVDLEANANRPGAPDVRAEKVGETRAVIVVGRAAEGAGPSRPVQIRSRDPHPFRGRRILTIVSARRPCPHNLLLV